VRLGVEVVHHALAVAFHVLGVAIARRYTAHDGM
jgi:hypothetical protein